MFHKRLPRGSSSAIHDTLESFFLDVISQLALTGRLSITHSFTNTLRVWHCWLHDAFLGLIKQWFYNLHNPWNFVYFPKTKIYVPWLWLKCVLNKDGRWRERSPKNMPRNRKMFWQNDILKGGKVIQECVDNVMTKPHQYVLVVCSTKWY